MLFILKKIKKMNYHSIHEWRTVMKHNLTFCFLFFGTWFFSLSSSLRICCFPQNQWYVLHLPLMPHSNLLGFWWFSLLHWFGLAKFHSANLCILHLRSLWDLSFLPELKHWDSFFTLHFYLHQQSTPFHESQKLHFCKHCLQLFLLSLS